jgi:membrane protein required for colicin V production
MLVIDILIGAYMIYKIYTGFLNGFISELTSLLAIAIALLAATHFYGQTLDFMRLFISSDNLTDMTIFSRIITFVVVLMLVLTAGNILTKMIDFAQMGIFNKILGAGFGLLKSILILSIFLNIFAKFNAQKMMVSPKHILESHLFHPIMGVSHVIFPIFGSWYEQFVFRPEPTQEPQNDKTDSDQKK